MEPDFNVDEVLTEMQQFLTPAIHKRLLHDFDHSTGWLDFLARVSPYLEPTVEPVNAILQKYGIEPITLEEHAKKCVIALTVTQGRMPGTKAVRVNPDSVYGLN